MRKLTKSEIGGIEFKKMLTSMNVEGLGENETKYQFTIELQKISFKCDESFLGICNDSDGKQTGYGIILKNPDDVSVDAVFITECFASEAFTLLGAYAGSVYMHNRLLDIYIKRYTNIRFRYK